MGNIKEINIKNKTNDYDQFNEFDPNLLKMDKISYKNIDIYYIDYMTV